MTKLQSQAGHCQLGDHSFPIIAIGKRAFDCFFLNSRSSPHDALKRPFRICSHEFTNSRPKIPGDCRLFARHQGITGLGI